MSHQVSNNNKKKDLTSRESQNAEALRFSTTGTEKKTLRPAENNFSTHLFPSP